MAVRSMSLDLAGDEIESIPRRVGCASDAQVGAWDACAGTLTPAHHNESCCVEQTRITILSFELPVQSTCDLSQML
jgi:hypothetical protein